MWGQGVGDIKQESAIERRRFVYMTQPHDRVMQRPPLWRRF